MGGIQTFINQVTSIDFDYKQYIIDTEEDFISSKAPEKPVYEYSTSTKIERIAYDIFSILFFPLGLYRLLHILAGKGVVLAQTPALLNQGMIEKIILQIQVGKFKVLAQIPALLDQAKKEMEEGLMNSRKLHFKFLKSSSPGLDQHVAKRVSVLVNEKKVDAWIYGKRKNLNNKKWTLFSNGNGGYMEHLSSSQLTDLDDMNVLIYNYQGVGASEGSSTKNGIVNAHKAMLSFLEDEENGIGAKVIVQRGVSLGGGVQGHAAKTHKQKEGVKYVYIKEQTFSKISKVPGDFLGFLLKILGWELSSVSSSEKLEEKGCPEIVIHKAEEMSHLTADQIQHDSVLPKESAKAYHLLRVQEKTKKKWKHKKFIGVNVTHGNTFYNWKRRLQINKAIQRALSEDYNGFHKSATVA